MFAKSFYLKKTVKIDHVLLFFVHNYVLQKKYFSLQIFMRLLTLVIVLMQSNLNKIKMILWFKVEGQNDQDI